MCGGNGGTWEGDDSRLRENQKVKGIAQRWMSSYDPHVPTGRFPLLRGYLIEADRTMHRADGASAGYIGRRRFSRPGSAVAKVERQFSRAVSALAEEERYDDVFRRAAV